MATTSVIARSHSPVKQPGRRLSRSSAPRTMPVNSEASSSTSSTSTPKRTLQRSSHTPTADVKRERRSITRSPLKVNGRLADAEVSSPANGVMQNGDRGEGWPQASSSAASANGEYEASSDTAVPAVEAEDEDMETPSIRTRSKTKSMSPVKKAAAILPVKRKRSEPESENEVEVEETASVSELSVDENASVAVSETGTKDDGLGLAGLEDVEGEEEPEGEGEVPMPKPKSEVKEATSSAIADRKGGPRRKRKGEVEPEAPAVIEARRARHALIDSALLDLEKQEAMIRSGEHPLVEKLMEELEARRNVKMSQAEKRVEAVRKEAAHVREQNALAARCQWHTAKLDLQEATVRSNIRRAHAARRERTGWQFARLPEYLQVGRIPFDAGAGWRFDPGPLLSDPKADFISFVNDDNTVAKRRRVEKGITGLGSEARRHDLEKMGVIRPARHYKRDPLEGPGPLPSARLPPPVPSTRMFDRNPYGYVMPPQPQQRINQLPAEYQTAPAPDFRDNRQNMPWWQPSTFPTSTPSLPPPTNSQSHHHHHKHHHHHHHAPRQSYPYTSQAPPPLPPPQQPPRPAYYEHGESLAKTNAFYRNLLAS